jgi:hypothetical protein
MDESKNQKGKIVAKSDCVLFKVSSKWQRRSQMLCTQKTMYFMLVIFVALSSVGFFLHIVQNTYNLMETAYNSEPKVFGFKLGKTKTIPPTYWQVH